MGRSRGHRLIDSTQCRATVVAIAGSR
jgi:hypothetical protein